MNQVLPNTRAIRSELKSSGSIALLTEVLKAVEDKWTESLKTAYGDDKEAAKATFLEQRQRSSSERFLDLFANGELLPPQVFYAMLEQSPTVKVNGSLFSWSQESNMLQLRDDCVRAYEPVLKQARANLLKPQLNHDDVHRLVNRWFLWEDAWLTEMENHSVEALQPLCRAILSLEPLIKSKKRASMMPYPARISENLKTVKCVQGFLNMVGGLSAATLSSVEREHNPDATLLVLMDHLLREYDDELAKNFTTFYGLSDDSDATFYDSHLDKNIPLASSHGYAFRISPDEATIERNAMRAERLFEALEDLKGYLEQTACDLNICSPDLEQNQMLKAKLEQFEKAYKNAKKCLEPENLL